MTRTDWGETNTYMGRPLDGVWYASWDDARLKEAIELDLADLDEDAEFFGPEITRYYANSLLPMADALEIKGHAEEAQKLREIVKNYLS